LEKGLKDTGLSALKSAPKAEQEEERKSSAFKRVLPAGRIGAIRPKAGERLTPSPKSSGGDEN
jgi:hypothetical protein